MKLQEDTFLKEQESRRLFIRDFLAATGWVILGGAELSRSTQVVIAGDRENHDMTYGSLKGRILYDGVVPEQTPIDLESYNLSPTDLAWFKSAGPVLNQDWVVDPKSKAVQWVFVWLQPLESSDRFNVHESLKVIAPDKKWITVDQEPTGYVPHAVAMQEGQGLLMRNTGPIAHVFNFLGFANQAFNRAMAPKSEIEVPDLKKERITVQVNCPPHPWERMFLRVFDHPYFAVTRADGTFEFKNVPQGPCRLVVWHEKLGFRGGRAGRNGSEISIEGGAVTDLGEILITPTATI